MSAVSSASLSPAHAHEVTAVRETIKARMTLFFMSVVVNHIHPCADVLLAAATAYQQRVAALYQYISVQAVYYSPFAFR